MRFVVEAFLGLALLAVGIEHLCREWTWFAANGSSDYLLIAGAIAAFVGLVYALDRLAEEQGWLVHHWWED